MTQNKNPPATKKQADRQTWQRTVVPFPLDILYNWLCIQAVISLTDWAEQEKRSSNGRDEIRSIVHISGYWTGITATGCGGIGTSSGRYGVLCCIAERFGMGILFVFAFLIAIGRLGKIFTWDEMHHSCFACKQTTAMLEFTELRQTTDLAEDGEHLE